MECHHIQPPTAETLPRGRENEPILASDEKRRASPFESGTTLLAFNPPKHCTDGDKCNKTPQFGHSIERARSRVVNLWATYRRKTWSMYLFLIAGTLFAVGHHLFYLSLQDKEAKNQSLMFRYGTVLAFCSKVSLSTAAIIAFRQRAWMVARHRMVCLGAIDSIFTAAEDIAALLDWTAMKKAKVATCLAIYVWMTPLIVILTSETLSAVAGTKEEAGFCPSARTLDFTHEETSDWRSPQRINDLVKLSVSIYNITGIEATLRPNQPDYWNQPAKQCELLVDRVVNLRQAVVRENAATEICPEGWNCSYVVDFIAPSYKCEELASGVGSRVKNLGDSEAPFGTDSIVPGGDYTYLAVTDRGEYAAQQVPSMVGGVPRMEPPYPRNLGAFRTEPIIWIGYAAVNDTSVQQPENSSVKGWDDAYTPTIFGCEHYETNYTVEFRYTSGVQTYGIKRREYLRKVVDTTFIPNKASNDGTWDNTTASPKNNYVFPTNVREYRRVAAYHSLGYAFRSYLNGTIALPHSIVQGNILATSFITLPNYLPIKHLREGVQKLYEDIIISLLSEPSFLAVSWASNGRPSGNVRGGAETSYPCVRQRLTTFFTYNKAQLLTVYVVSITIALVGVLLGLEAVREEGVLRDMKPSSIIGATRAPSLHELQSGSDQYTKKLRVGFGWVQEQSGGSVRGFGLEGDVTQEPPRPLKALWKTGLGRTTPSANYNTEGSCA